MKGVARPLLVVAVGTVVALIGCAPTPERVCDYQMELAVRQTDKSAAATAEDKRAAMRDKCVLALVDVKKRDRKEFECRGKCILQAKFFDDVETCHSLCAAADGALGDRAVGKSAASAGKRTDDEAKDAKSGKGSPKGKK